MEVQPQHRVGVEDQPAALVGREVGAEDLTDTRQRPRQVEVVVEGRYESVVEVASGVGQGSSGLMGSIRDLVS